MPSLRRKRPSTSAPIPKPTGVLPAGANLADWVQPVDRLIRGLTVYEPWVFVHRTDPVIAPHTAPVSTVLRQPAGRPTAADVRPNPHLDLIPRSTGRRNVGVISLGPVTGLLSPEVSLADELFASDTRRVFRGTRSEREFRPSCENAVRKLPPGRRVTLSLAHWADVRSLALAPLRGTLARRDRVGLVASAAHGKCPAVYGRAGASATLDLASTLDASRDWP